MSLWPGTGAIWVIGCGNMGGALLERWLACGLESARVTVIDPAPPRIEGVRWLSSLPDGQPDLLMLGIKPQMLGDMSAAISPHVGGDTALLSILAGVECATLSGHFPNAKAIVRSMPNLPASLGKGVTGLFSSDADQSTQAAISALFDSTGQAEWLANEDQFHAIIAVAGSAPAFVYRFIGALVDGGVALGLPADQALRLARATVEGAAALSIASGDDPVELARRVTSPNGTTAAGLEALDEGGEFAAMIAKTMRVTAERSQELANEAKREA